MATYADIEMEWAALRPDMPERWTDNDLQLAAELGKTLLERNKELENTLRQQQTLVDDQTQEIEYLTKQTAALREVNDSRLRIYEQLEVSIQELERNNQRLAVENAADKKQIKSLCHSLDTMEMRCEELTRSLEEAQTAERQRQRGKDEGNTEEHSMATNNNKVGDSNQGISDEETLAAQVGLLRAQKDRESRRAEELEEQLTTLIQENATLEEQMTAYKMREEQLRALEEEISSMQGHQMCFRCMRRFGGTGTGASTATPSLMDEDISSSVMEDESCLDEETDLETEVQSIASETHNTVLSDNPYRVLVEKYEALLSMQRRPARRVQGKCPSPAPSGLMLGHLCSSPLPPTAGDTNCMSLQEELQMSGEFNGSGPVSLMLEDFSKVEEGEPRDTQLKLQNTAGLGQLYFSEAETNSSSGVSEGDLPRSQHRATQTDLMSGGGKLLWSISAGNSTDCVVNVYDEGSDPTETRFQRTPEYRELFSEIFSVLKRSVARSSAIETSERLSTVNAAIVDRNDVSEKKMKKFAESQLIVRGQADDGEDEAGKIEEITKTSDTSPSSILSLAAQRKSRKSKGRKERKAEQLRRKVLSVSPERFNQEVRKAAAPLPEPVPVVEMEPQVSRDQSPAMSDRSDRSKKGRHWAKRGRPLPLGGTSWPWNRWSNQPPPQSAPSPLVTCSSNSQQQPPPPPPAPGPSNEHKPIAFTSSASADVARLRRLEKSYADVLRSSLPKTHRRK